MATAAISWLSVAVAVANWTLKAGRKPPSAIFITRASTSLVEARGALALAPPGAAAHPHPVLRHPVLRHPVQRRQPGIQAGRHPGRPRSCESADLLGSAGAPP